jgi:hypothetical protein
MMTLSVAQHEPKLFLAALNPYLAEAGFIIVYLKMISSVSFSCFIYKIHEAEQ